MKRLTFANRSNWLPMAATMVFTAALTALLAYGIIRTARLQAASAALQTASELSTQPQLLRSELTLIQRGLESATFVSDSLRNVAAGRSSSEAAFGKLTTNIADAGLRDDTEVTDALAAARSNWQTLNQSLQTMTEVDPAQLYVDSASGSTLTPYGQQLQRTVNALLTTQSAASRVLTTNLATLSAALRQNVVRNGAALRSLLLAATALAALLVAMMLYFAVRARRSGAAAADAERQVHNILDTVREGLFLVGRDGRIGTAYSTSLTGLLHRDSPAGLTLEEVLKPLVDAKTLTAAGKYLNLLWSERVNAELIESVNPLQQIAVNFARAGGGHETRYLSFVFHRARDASDYVLGAVADVTDRVMLQQELAQLKTENDGNGAHLMQMLRVDPAQMDAFLANADRAFHNSNALLSAPGREQAALRDKLDGVFRELHAVKGEAAALGLESFARRIHAAEDILGDLRTQNELRGSDFVPVVTHLDELISEAAGLAEARQRIAEMTRQQGQPTRTAPAPAGGAHAGAAAPDAGRSLEAMLRSLAADVGRAHGRSLQLHLDGLGSVPASHERRIKDIAVQMVRNAIVHGLEPPEQRAAQGKPPEGSVRVRFTDNGADDYALLIEDDGGGLSYEQIINRALELGLIKPTQAAAMDRAAVFRLIFMPGFSTAENTSEHAGRGVGLDVVNTLVRDSGGRISISTTPGQYTRFKVLLPRTMAMARPAA